MKNLGGHPVRVLEKIRKRAVSRRAARPGLLATIRRVRWSPPNLHFAALFALLLAAPAPAGDTAVRTKRDPLEELRGGSQVPVHAGPR